jgi:hypothetical protein
MQCKLAAPRNSKAVPAVQPDLQKQPVRPSLNTPSAKRVYDEVRSPPTGVSLLNDNIVELISVMKNLSPLAKQQKPDFEDSFRHFLAKASDGVRASEQPHLVSPELSIDKEATGN